MSRLIPNLDDVLEDPLVQATLVPAARNRHTPLERGVEIDLRQMVVVEVLEVELSNTRQPLKRVALGELEVEDLQSEATEGFGRWSVEAPADCRDPLLGADELVHVDAELE